jgi:hypothetical protein
MAAKRGWIVSTSGERPLQDIAQDLTEAGFTISRVLDQIGSIVGTASDDIIENLRAIPGVTDISPEEDIDIGPPDAPVT